VLSFAAQAEVAVDDVATDGRWPELAPRLAEAGVRAVLGVPTRLGGAAVGSLNVYCATPHPWDLGERQAIAAFNGLVERSLAQAVAARQQGRVVEQLQYALDNRIVVERAIGMLMARHDVDGPAAFGLLRTAARSSRRRVGDVAREILASTSTPAPPSPSA
jgi:GAF domain-containing protein